MKSLAVELALKYLLPLATGYLTSLLHDAFKRASAFIASLSPGKQQAVVATEAAVLSTFAQLIPGLCGGPACTLDTLSASALATFLVALAAKHSRQIAQRASGA